MYYLILCSEIMDRRIHWVSRSDFSFSVPKRFSVHPSSHMGVQVSLNNVRNIFINFSRTIFYGWSFLIARSTRTGSSNTGDPYTPSTRRLLSFWGFHYYYLVIYGELLRNVLHFWPKMYLFYILDSIRSEECKIL